MSPSRVLVTGASGCLGRPLAERLVQEGRQVVGLDIRPAGSPVAFHEVTADVGEPHLLHRLFADHRFDAVVHCGGISGQMVATDDPYKNCQVNVFGTVHLLEVARARGVGRFLYCSSQGAYGTRTAPVLDENSPMLPVTVYGGTKAACDMLVRAYRIQHGVDATSLRIGRVYGPGRRTSSLITTMVDAALAGRKLRLPSSRGRRLQYVYEMDIVSALHLALDRTDLPLNAYNVSGPGSHTDEEVAAALAALVPGTDIAFDDGPLDDGTFFSATLDCSAAHRDFGYEPTYDLERGLAAFIDHRRHGKS